MSLPSTTIRLCFTHFSSFTVHAQAVVEGKEGERYEGETLPKCMGEVPADDGKGLEALDVAAVLHPSTSENGDGKRKLVLAVINRTQEDVSAKIRIAFGKVAGEEAEVWEVWDEDLVATNTWEEGERVKAVRSVERVSQWNKESRMWKRHGVCLVVLEVVLDGGISSHAL
jgi:hypothetical protein